MSTDRLGSLVFRDEEGLLERSGETFDLFHDRVIAPYKGDLECWYSENQSLFLYVKIIVVTAISTMVPRYNSLKHFNGCPAPPKELSALLFNAPS